jgi:endoglucanase
MDYYIMASRTSLGPGAVCWAIIALCFVFPAGYSRAHGAANTPMRSMTAKQLVYDMNVGWNLGNTMDATTGGETGWGNPKTTQAMIDAVKAMGFKTVRIPVTWEGNIGPSPEYAITGAWLDRVEEIANYVLRDSMYAIINSHHDSWVTLTASSQSTVSEKLAKVWTQIATRFRNYSDYLVFETLNEPRGTANEWTGGTAETRGILNRYHAAAVGAIRATGGNNASRLIMICGHAATPTTVCVSDIVIPNSDPRCVVSLHTYYPNEFSFGGQTNWGTATDQANAIKELDRERNDVSTKGGGTAIIGEWGSIDQNNLAARVAHAEFYTREARARGLLTIWWDNGASDFVILNRKTNPPSWTWPTIAQAIVRGANNAVLPVERAAAAGTIQPITGLMEREGIIAYVLTEPSFVSLRLFDTQGRIISNMVKSVQPAGDHSIAMPANGISSGSYLLEFRAGNRQAVKRIAVSR